MVSVTNCHKLGDLKQQKISLPVLEARSLKSRCQQGYISPGICDCMYISHLAHASVDSGCFCTLAPINIGVVNMSLQIAL
jgi:hypothetical protein